MNPVSRNLWNRQTATEKAHKSSTLVTMEHDASTSASLRISRAIAIKCHRTRTGQIKGVVNDRVICSKKEFVEENSQVVGKTCCPCQTDLRKGSLLTAILAKEVNAEHLRSTH